jgi:hypothetical protein
MLQIYTSTVEGAPDGAVSHLEGFISSKIEAYYLELMWAG